MTQNLNRGEVCQAKKAQRMPENSENQLDPRETQNVPFLIKSVNQEHKFHLIILLILHFKRLGFVQIYVLKQTSADLLKMNKIIHSLGKRPV